MEEEKNEGSENERKKGYCGHREMVFNDSAVITDVKQIGLGCDRICITSSIV